MPPATTRSSSPARIIWSAMAMALSARQADLVDRDGGDLLGDPGRDRGLAGGDLARPGLQHVAHDHVVDLVGRDAGRAPGPPGSRRRRARPPGSPASAPPNFPMGVRAPVHDHASASCARSSTVRGGSRDGPAAGLARGAVRAATRLLDDVEDLLADQLVARDQRVAERRDQSRFSASTAPTRSFCASRMSSTRCLALASPSTLPTRFVPPIGPCAPPRRRSATRPSRGRRP